METENEKLTGTVENVTYRNDINGYTVLEVDSQEELVTVVGIMPEIQSGEQIECFGSWGFHKVHGRQFNASSITQTMPADTAGILRYLSSGVISGVRESTALKMVEAFGENTLDVIEKDPERLAQIKGISLAKAKKISREFKTQFAVREAMLGLTSLGFTQSEAINAYNVFKDEAYDILKVNPYCFVGVDNGISFDRAEEIAEGKNIPFGFKSEAAVLHIISHNLRNGHTCLPRKSIIQPLEDMLGCMDDDVEIAIDNNIEEKKLVSKNINSKEFLFLPEIYEAERNIADRIDVMTKFPPRQSEIFASEVTAFELSNNIKFDQMQRQAIEIAVNKGLLILTGGPGTGKTTTVKGIITLMKNRGLSVALTAPTGRAAKRMSELTGEEAKTIHRLLEVEYKDGEEKASFKYNLHNTLDVDAVIVDELSMVDVTVFNSLLDALPLGCRLVMVGDKDQLPPVGAGNVLSDLIKSGRIPVVRLEKIFRQAMKSLIVTNAHKVVSGEMPELSRNDEDSDFFLLKENDSYSASSKITGLVTSRLPKKYGLNSVSDIQVLCPSRKGECGTANLNKMLQSVLNPPDKRKKELYFKGYILREGDKVMQIKNNYDVPWFKSGESGTGVFNGDIGILERIDIESDVFNVRFDDRDAMYSSESVKELELAYAMTVHKSQGSEFDAVVMPVVNINPLLAYRNLFYTAITRAKNLIVLVGSEGQIEKMVNNDKKSRRYSALDYFLSVDNSEDLF